MLTPTLNQALVLSDSPERHRLRELQAALESLRDSIAELDLEIETLRMDLGEFERDYRLALRDEHDRLSRIERLVQHTERWIDLLASEPPTGLTKRAMEKRARRVDQRRRRELEEQQEEERTFERTAGEDDAGDDLEDAGPSVDERLKKAYRALARRFHPDLARSEDERVSHGRLMAKINELYRTRDLERLIVLGEQAKGGDLDELSENTEQQIVALEERLAWFTSVLGNLEEERLGIEQSPTCQLYRDLEQARAVGRDLFAELKDKLRERATLAYREVGRAAHRLETAVKSYNRNANTALAQHQRRAHDLDRCFDAHADKRLIRLALDELATLRVSPAAARLAEEMDAWQDSSPALLRLVLLTYVSELSPYPLPGLETYDDISLRFAALATQDATPRALEHALVDADTLVEFGVKGKDDRRAHQGLRFRSDHAREAVPAALKSLSIRREFRRLLGVLGERVHCDGCHDEVFSVPLFRTRGLDDLRALVCPSCGHTLRCYWMPKGKDVQAVLNAAFLDFELVHEWSFRLGRGSVATQLLPLQEEKLSVGELKKQLHADIFKRNEIELDATDLELWQDGQRVSERKKLGGLGARSFVLRFGTAAALKEGDALEVVRHRIRTRFQR